MTQQLVRARHDVYMTPCNGQPSCYRPIWRRLFVALASKGFHWGEFLRRALEAALAGTGETQRKADPLFSDVSVYDGSVSADLAANHDDYLYGENGEP